MKTMQIIIANQLTGRIGISAASYKIITFKRLSRKELGIAKKYDIKRFYFPKLRKDEAARFFSEFDVFWDQVVSSFPLHHPFWRNIASCKKFLWDDSIGQLCLVLFMLAQLAEKEPQKIIILCNSIEMTEVCAEWAKKHGWRFSVISRFVFFNLINRILQKLVNFGLFFVGIVICIYEKMISYYAFQKAYFGDEPILLSSQFYFRSFGGGTYRDPFLGFIHNYLAEKGLKFVYLSRPLEKLNISRAKVVAGCIKMPVLIPSLVVKWRDLFGAFTGLLFRKIRFSKSQFEGCDFSKVMAWNARSFRGQYNLSAEILFRATRRLCLAHNFTRLIYSTEGTLMESACVQAFRLYSSGWIVGYSQTTIFPLDLNLRLSPREVKIKPDADKIICTGLEAKKWLQKVSNREPAKIKAGCIIREISSAEHIYCEAGHSQQILIALDGQGQLSTSLLVDWLIENSEKFKEFSVCLRFHPNMPAQIVLGQCFYALPAHFRISNANLTEDIRASLCVFYRHSSVGFQSILNGIPAVHLAIDTPLSGDSMQELNDFKWIVYDSDDIEKAVEQIQTLKVEERRAMLRKAEEYVKGFFAAFSEERMNDFLAN